MRATVTRLYVGGYIFGKGTQPDYNNQIVGDVAELADAHDLESCAARRVGSSPSIPISKAMRRCQGNASLFTAACRMKDCAKRIEYAARMDRQGLLEGEFRGDG